VTVLYADYDDDNPAVRSLISCYERLGYTIKRIERRPDRLLSGEIGWTEEDHKFAKAIGMSLE
jgi:hypothetical protein